MPHEDIFGFEVFRSRQVHSQVYSTIIQGGTDEVAEIRGPGWVPDLFDGVNLESFRRKP